MPTWNLLFTFPNFIPPVPTPYASTYVTLCSADDPLLENLSRNRARPTARLLLRRHRTNLGTAYRPGCLLVRADAPPSALDASALRSFRNVCAIATTTRAWAEGLAHPYGANAQWVYKWSDALSLGYHTPGVSGALVTLEGPSQGLNSARNLEKFRTHASELLGLPTNYHSVVDSGLLARLLVVWTRYYIQRRERRTWRSLFRSLEVAFHAGMYPSDGLPSINDAGARLGLWVSAFEVLFHPGGTGKVNKHVVQNLLSTVPWTDDRLKAKRFKVSYGANTYRVGLAEAIYDDLYQARNYFMHGQSVAVNDLHYRQSKRYPLLTQIAPILFNAALLAHLRGRVSGGPESPKLDQHYFARLMAGIGIVEDALLAANVSSV